DWPRRRPARPFAAADRVANLFAWFPSPTSPQPAANPAFAKKSSPRKASRHPVSYYPAIPPNITDEATAQAREKLWWSLHLPAKSQTMSWGWRRGQSRSPCRLARNRGTHDESL